MGSPVQPVQSLLNVSNKRRPQREHLGVSLNSVMCLAPIGLWFFETMKVNYATNLLVPYWFQK